MVRVEASTVLAGVTLGVESAAGQAAMEVVRAEEVVLGG